MARLTTQETKKIIEFIRIANSNLNMSTPEKNEILNFLGNITYSDYIGVYLYSSKIQKFVHPLSKNLSGKFLQEFESHYYKIDPFIKHFFKNHEVFLSTDVISKTSFRQSAIYNELYRPEGLHHALVVPIYSEEKPLGIIGIWRTECEKNFCVNELLSMKILQPHISNLAKNLILFNRILERKNISDTILTTLDKGIFIFDLDFRLVYMNKAAYDFCLKSTKGFLSGIKTTHFLKIDGDVRIPKEIYDDYKGMKEVFFRSEDTQKYPLRETIIEVSPFEKYSLRSLIWPGEKLLDHKPHYIIAIIEEISPDKRIRYENLREKYCLTNREIEIIKLLLQGYKNIELADKLSISGETVKIHIKNIFEKMEIKNRMSIVPRLLEVG